MRELGIARIGDHAGREPVASAVGRNRRQEGRQPRAEFRLRKHAAHEIRFGEAWREKVLAGRFILQRAAAILEVEVARARDEQRLERLMFRGARPPRLRAAGWPGPARAPARPTRAVRPRAAGATPARKVARTTRALHP